jgi:hypothetical protein
MDDQPEMVVRVQFNDEWIVRFQVKFTFLLLRDILFDLTDLNYPWRAHPS